MLIRGEFVVEGHKHASAVEDYISRNQPLRLIRHDNRPAITGLECSVLQRASDWRGDIFEVRIGEACFFLVPVRFNQTELIRPLLQRVTQSGSETTVSGEIKH